MKPNTLSATGVAALVVLIVLIVSVTPPRVQAADIDPKLQAEFDEAARAMIYYKFDRSYIAYGNLLRKLKPDDGELWEKAVLGRAMSGQSIQPNNNDRLREAVRRYSELANSGSKSPRAARAMLQLGRLADLGLNPDQSDGEPNVDVALEHYRKVFTDWPDLPIAHEAALRYGSSQISAGDIERIRPGVDFFLQWLEKHPGPGPYTSIMWEAIGDTAHALLQDPGLAVRAYINAIEIGLANEVGLGNIAWNIATIAKKDLKDIPTAVKYYRRVITDAPKSGMAFDAWRQLQEIDRQFPDMDIDLTPPSAGPSDTMPTSPGHTDTQANTESVSS